MADSDPHPQHGAFTFSKKVWITAGIFSLLILLLLLLKTLFSVILLALAGILLAIYFRGFAGLLNRFFHWPARLCLLTAVGVNVILVAGFIWFAGARLQQQITELSGTLPQTIQHLKDQLSQSKTGTRLLAFAHESADSIQTESFARHFFSGSFGALSDLYLVGLFGIFFTADPLLYKKGVVRLLPAKAKDKGEKLLDELNSVLKKWLKAQIIGFFFIAVSTGIGLWIVGMPLVLTLALMAGILNFIPNFGPLIALIPAVLLALMQGFSTALIVAAIYTGVQIIQSAVTQPIIQKKMVSLPPALTIFAQVAFGMMAGFWGVLLATPLVVILLKLVDRLYVDHQQPQNQAIQ